MEVFQLKKVLCFTILSFFLSACDNNQNETEVFQEPDPQCHGSTIPGHFIVKWKSGKITFETSASRYEFLENFVKPFKEQIEYAEFDQLLSAPTILPLNIQTKDIPDNIGPERIEASYAWQQNIYGSGITVAVVDTGLDIHHESLKNQIAYNSGETGLDSFGNDKRFNDVDDDQNGFVDDYAGYDFYAETHLMSDPSAHGTHVSGVIAAEHQDTDYRFGYVQGVAPKSKILPVRFIGPSGGATSDAIRGIDYAVKMGAKIINASWGGGSACTNSLRDKIATLSAANVLFVGASGNEFWNIDQIIVAPASFNLLSQITVGAIGNTNIMADFSNYGFTSVHLFAPGVNIISTVPNNGEQSADGTSMSTPFVSGAAALLWSVNPSAHYSTIRNALLNSVDTENYYQNATQGRLNIRKAIDQIQ